MSRRFIYLDYNQISMKMDAMIDAIISQSFTAIAVIVRGGLFPAAHISVRTGLPMFYLSHKGTPMWIGNQPPQKSKLLIVEDLAGSGRTLLDCQQFVEDGGYEYQSLVIWKDTLSASTPEFIGFESIDPMESFILPWEKAIKLNPKSRIQDGIKLPDHELEFTGWDMDGIFLEDVPSEIYRIGLPHALAVRDQYPPADIQPTLGKKDVIITGRPTIDEERTFKWLSDHNLHLPAYFRDDQIEKPTAQTTALWKGQKAISLGCYRYVESDSEQAMHIAANYPLLEVVWWNNGNPITLKASSLVTSDSVVTADALITA